MHHHFNRTLHWSECAGPTVGLNSEAKNISSSSSVTFLPLSESSLLLLRPVHPELVDAWLRTGLRSMFFIKAVQPAISSPLVALWLPSSRRAWALLTTVSFLTTFFYQLVDKPAPGADMAYSMLRRSCERSAQEDSADKVLKKMKVAVTSRPASQFPAVASAFEGGHSNSLDSCYEFATGISK